MFKCCHKFLGNGQKQVLVDTQEILGCIVTLFIGIKEQVVFELIGMAEMIN